MKFVAFLSYRSGQNLRDPNLWKLKLGTSSLRVSYTCSIVIKKLAGTFSAFKRSTNAHI